MVSLTGCGKRLEVRPTIVTETRVEKVQVPAELLEPCAEPDLDQLETTADLERVAIDAIVALVFCNADKTAIREWQSE
jgi:hypothetical protein